MSWKLKREGKFAFVIVAVKLFAMLPNVNGFLHSEKKNDLDQAEYIQSKYEVSDAVRR